MDETLESRQTPNTLPASSRYEDACDRFIVRSIPFADIVTVEIRKGETRGRVLMGVGLVAAFVATSMGVLNITGPTN